jgi:DNA gyrase inhibitor GyrI
MVESWAKEKGIDCKDSFGQYLDNPDIVEEARLKARVGCMVQEKPMDLPAQGACGGTTIQSVPTVL